MNFYIHTFGCKVNSYESACLSRNLQDISYVSSDDYKNCDIIIINSCTVTSQGDSRVLSALKKYRKECPDAVLVLTGCFPQTHAAKIESIDADIITGTKNRKAIPAYIQRFLSTHEKIMDVSDYKKGDEFEEMSFTEFTGHTRAFIKIQDGCNQFCSYCTIPYARGRCRSKTPDALRKELESVAKSGYREVVFCGINIAFWGDEFGLSLKDAVKIADETDGIERIRLGSLEPEKLTLADLEYFAESKKFCPQFHLSLQSGCDETLKRMNRKYDSSDYRKLAETIKKLFPDAAFTTDVMVGFPGETDEEFEKSAEFVKSIGFSKVHIFRYSRREGTVADRMPNQVPENIKIKRAEKLSEICRDSQKKFNESLIGKVFPVLFERQNEPDYLHGHAPNGAVIKISSKNYEKGLRNQIFYVIIKECNDKFCFGEIIQDN